MTTEEFRDLLQQQSDPQLLSPCLHDDRTPYVFEPQPAAWDTFRDELVSGLAVSRPDIRVVGSARFGFSTKPGRNLREFSDTSDIDVVIVSPSLFDQLWLALLDAAYPRPPIAQKLGGWLQTRRNEVYTGWLTPMEIRLDFRIVETKGKARARLQNSVVQRTEESITTSSEKTRRHYGALISELAARRTLPSAQSRGAQKNTSGMRLIT